MKEPVQRIKRKSTEQQKMFANMYLTKEEYLEYIKNSKNSTINQTMKIHNGQKAFYQSGYIVSK